jgi:hypothetical protein
MVAAVELVSVAWEVVVVAVVAAVVVIGTPAAFFCYGGEFY